MSVYSTNYLNKYKKIEKIADKSVTKNKTDNFNGTQ